MRLQPYNINFYSPKYTPKPVERKPELPQVVNPLPEEAALTKYTSYPVDLCYGLPRIEIPLYEIVDGDIHIPITLSYHASGLKPNQLNSIWLGEGWSLSCGPSLSRTINGGPDECRYFNPELEPRGEPGSSADLRWRALYNNGYDPQLDLFHYSLLKQSGSLYLARQQSGEQDATAIEPITVPYSPIQVNCPLGKKIKEIKVNDGKGLEYTFGGNDRRFRDLVPWPTLPDTIPSAWKIRKIQSALTGRTITYDYYRSSLEITTSERFTDDVVLLEDVSTTSYLLPLVNMTDSTGLRRWFQVESNGNLYPAQDAIVDAFMREYGYTPRSGAGAQHSCFETVPKSITFTGGTVEFVRWGGDNATGKKRWLKGMVVKDNNGNIVRQISFVHQLDGSSDGTIDLPSQALQLVSVMIESPSGNANETYTLEYNGDKPRPTKSVDRWGYYNGKPNYTKVPSINYNVLMQQGHSNGRELNF